MRFRSAQHIRTTREFDVVRQQGKRRDCGAFLLHMHVFTESDRPESVRRLGVVASRRVGNAIRRSRAKRLLREVFRLNQEVLPVNCDVVLMARAAIRNFDFATLQRRFCAAIHQLTLEGAKTTGDPRTEVSP